MISWPNAAVLVVTFSLIAYVFGSIRMTRHQDERVEFLVNRGGRTASAVRYLYDYLDLLVPDLDARPEPEPSPSWWSRLVGWWERKTRPVPATLNSEPEIPRFDEELANEPAASNVPMSQSLGHPVESEKFGVDLDDEPIGPATSPEMPDVSGPETVPTAVVIATDWEARQAQLMAEFQAAADEISGVKR